MAKAHAVSSKMSISKAISDLLRRRISAPQAAAPSSDSAEGVRFHPVSGFPISKSDGRTITSEDVQRMLDEDDLRYAEFFRQKPATSFEE